MTDQKCSVLEAPSIDRNRRGRRTVGAHPRKAVARVGVAGTLSVPVADRVHRETTLMGALELVEEGLTAAEESYRRVLAVFEARLGPDHPEVADVHRRLSESEDARGHSEQAEYHARRALEIESALGSVLLRPMAESAERALT
jgi:Tetratricopeptide repeat